MTSRFLLTLTLVAAAPAQAQSFAPADSGVFVLHKFMQPIGRERYTVAAEGTGRVITDSFAFTDRGRKVPLVTTLALGGDQAPTAFTIRGSISRFSTIDASLERVGDSLRVRVDSAVRTVAAPRVWFAIGGYAPAVGQQELIRYWRDHGRPDSLRTYPEAWIHITERGADTVTTSTGPAALLRYAIDGLIWGRETVWTDADGRLIAAVTIDAEFDHFEALRDGWEPSLGFFVHRAAEDAAAGLVERTRSAVGGTGDFAIVGATIIDATGAPAIPNGTVLVRKGRIAAVGAHVRVPRGVAVVDGRGKSVLPGLWDMHAHYEQVEWGPIYLAAGVTTARAVGNEFDFITAVRDAVAAGRGV
ncbi:MAG: amidohydrolase, partial [Gemmatimonadales bacterium]